MYNRPFTECCVVLELYYWKSKIRSNTFNQLNTFNAWWITCYALVAELVEIEQYEIQRVYTSLIASEYHNTAAKTDRNPSNIIGFDINQSPQ